MPKRWKPDQHHDCQNAGEEQVFKSLERLASQNVIADFRHSYDYAREGEKKSEEAQKIDFVITAYGFETKMRLQVKSCKTRAAEHAAEHPDIPCIWVPNNLTQNEIDDKLKETIRRWESGDEGIYV